jgi:hypothetical protein
MHYWSAGTKADFLTDLRALNKTPSSFGGAAGRFKISEPGGSDLSLGNGVPASGTQVISLVPSALVLP